jgi:hypothetical protein
VQVAEGEQARRRLRQHERAYARYHDDVVAEQASLAARVAAGLSDVELRRVDLRVERLLAQRHVEGTEVDRAQRDIDRVEPEVERLVRTAQGNAREEGKLAELRLSLYWHEFINHHKDRDRIRWVLQATGNATPEHFRAFDLPPWVHAAWKEFMQ